MIHFMFTQIAPCGIWKSIFLLPLLYYVWISDVCPEMSLLGNMWMLKVMVDPAVTQVAYEAPFLTLFLSFSPFLT